MAEGEGGKAGGAVACLRAGARGVRGISADIKCYPRYQVSIKCGGGEAIVIVDRRRKKRSDGSR